MKNTSFVRSIALLMLLAVLCTVVSSCMTNSHTVGNGPQTGAVVKSRQWYALWGLVRLGDADTRQKVGDNPNYEIKTYTGFVDWVINLFLGPFSIKSRTIKITK